jgi:hypothetical protein
VIHIHNGDITATVAQRSGIPGRHVSFRESLIAGPVPRDVDVESRARFLSSGYGENLLRVRNDLLEQERTLDAAMKQDEIVLWFEHDLFCLVHLLKMLNRFGSHPRLTLVWCPRPLADQEELPILFESRSAVAPAMLTLAREAWGAYTSPDPLSLNRIVKDAAGDFPFLRDGMTLHASRFPSTRNGLGAVESRLLDTIAAGAADFATIFKHFDPEPPRFGFGDAEILRVLRGLASRSVPLLTVAGDEPGTLPPKALFALTPVAETVLGGAVDFIAMDDPDEWLGGVHLTRENVWRWDLQRREIVASRPAVS